MLGFQEQVAGGQQGPGRQAAAGGQDDGPPLPLLHAAGAPTRSRAAASAARSSAAAARSTRAGASTRSAPPDAAGALRRPQRDAARAARRTWSLTAMVMNHYQRSKRFYVRTRIWYTTEPRTPVYPTAVGDCRAPGQRHGLRRARRRRAGLDVHRPLDLDRAVQRPHPRRRLAPPRRRDQPDAGEPDVRPRRCSTPRPTTAPPTTRTTRSARSCTSRGRSPTARSAALQGIPVAAGEVLERAALHDNATLHVAAMGFWVLLLVRDDGVTACAPMPADVARGHRAREVRPRGAVRLRPRRCRSCSSRAGRWRAFNGADRSATSCSGRPRLTAKVGQRLTWRFAGVEPHSVTVANGPRGFSSNYLGNVTRQLLVHADRRRARTGSRA